MTKIIFSLFILLSLQLRADTIVFIHGVMDIGVAWWNLPKLVTEDGHRVLMYNYNSYAPYCSLTNEARHLSRMIESNVPEGEKVTFLCHSQGGLMAEWYIYCLGRADRVEKVITLATPYHGNIAASLIKKNRMPFPILKQQYDDLANFSPFIKRLFQKRTQSNIAIPFYTAIGFVSGIHGNEGDLIVSVPEGNRYADIYILSNSLLLKKTDETRSRTTITYLDTTHFPLFSKGLPAVMDRTHPAWKFIDSILKQGQPDVSTRKTPTEFGIISSTSAGAVWFDKRKIRKIYELDISEGVYRVMFFQQRKYAETSLLTVSGIPFFASPGRMTYLLDSKDGW